MNIISKYGYSVKKTKDNEKLILKAKKDLTVKPNETVYTCPFVDYSFKVFREDAEYLHVPRYFGTKHFGIPDKNIFKPEKLGEVNLVISARDYQKKPIDDIYGHLEKDGGCIMQVECGFGKTICSLILAHKLGLKTIIIAPKIQT